MKVDEYLLRKLYEKTMIYRIVSPDGKRSVNLTLEEYNRIKNLDREEFELWFELVSHEGGIVGYKPEYRND